MRSRGRRQPRGCDPRPGAAGSAISCRGPAADPEILEQPQRREAAVRRGRRRQRGGCVSAPRPRAGRVEARGDVHSAPERRTARRSTNALTPSGTRPGRPALSAPGSAAVSSIATRADALPHGERPEAVRGPSTFRGPRGGSIAATAPRTLHAPFASRRSDEGPTAARTATRPASSPTPTSLTAPKPAAGSSPPARRCWAIDRRHRRASTSRRPRTPAQQPGDRPGARRPVIPERQADRARAACAGRSPRGRSRAPRPRPGLAAPPPPWAAAASTSRCARARPAPARD
jgi:hypothetical protein